MGVYILEPKFIFTDGKYWRGFCNSIQNLRKFNLDFLDEYESCRFDGDYIVAYNETKTALYFIDDSEINLVKTF